MLTSHQIQEYQIMRNHFLNGELSEKQWFDFCSDLLFNIPALTEAFIRLKNN